MGFKVGLPVLKLKNAKSGGKNGGKKKNSGNLRSILDEAGKERWSSSNTLDRSLSDTNEHLGPYSSGEEAYKAIMEEVDAYNEAYKAEHGRGIRKDAVLAFALIVKPPAEVMNAMSPADRARFFSDSYDSLVELNALSDANVRMRERHRDEGGEHEHIVSMAYDRDGKLNGKGVVNLKMFKTLNKKFPELMRQKGWDVESCEVYDAEAVKDMTPEDAEAYKAQHRAKKAAQGLSANEYAARKRADAIEQEAAELAKEMIDVADCEAHVDVEEAADEAIIEAYIATEPKRRAARDADKRIEEADAREKAAKEAEEKAERTKSHVGLICVDMQHTLYPDRADYLHHMLDDTDTTLKNFEAFTAEQKRAAEANERYRAQLEKLADDIEATKADVAEMPEKGRWMLDWTQTHYPKVYAAAQKAYEAFVKPVADKVRNVQQRARSRFIPTRFQDIEDASRASRESDRDFGD